MTKSWMQQCPIGRVEEVRRRCQRGILQPAQTKAQIDLKRDVPNPVYMSLKQGKPHWAQTWRPRWITPRQLQRMGSQAPSVSTHHRFRWKEWSRVPYRTFTGWVQGDNTVWWSQSMKLPRKDIEPYPSVLEFSQGCQSDEGWLRCYWGHSLGSHYSYPLCQIAFCQQGLHGRRGPSLFWTFQPLCQMEENGSQTGLSSPQASWGSRGDQSSWGLKPEDPPRMWETQGHQASSFHEWKGTHEDEQLPTRLQDKGQEREMVEE